MSAEVVGFTGITRLPEDPNTLLAKAQGWNLEQVVVIGWDKDGKFVHGGSHCEVAAIILLLEVAKKRMIEHADEVTS